MLEPILVDPSEIDTKEFEPVPVGRAGRSVDGVQQYPMRHYAQAATRIDRDELRKALLRLGIGPIKKVTVFGGYTGEFATALRDLGSEVLFTDPMQVWVDRARRNGFQTNLSTAEEISAAMIGASDAMATFECYMPFTSEGLSMYTAMRFLTTRFGILFAESDATRIELRQNMLSRATRTRQTPSLMSYLSGYGLASAFTNAGGLRIYRFSIPETSRCIVLQDLLVLKTMHDLIADEMEVGAEEVRLVSRASGLGPEEVVTSITRMAGMADLRLKRESPSISPLHGGRLWIGSKMFSFRKWGQ
jgi:hypothetical protein